MTADVRSSRMLANSTQHAFDIYDYLIGFREIHKPRMQSFIHNQAIFHVQYMIHARCQIGIMGHH
jgi:hypothetical protein